MSPGRLSRQSHYENRRQQLRRMIYITPARYKNTQNLYECQPAAVCNRIVKQILVTELDQKKFARDLMPAVDGAGQLLLNTNARHIW